MKDKVKDHEDRMTALENENKLLEMRLNKVEQKLEEETESENESDNSLLIQKENERRSKSKNLTLNQSPEIKKTANNLNFKLALLKHLVDMAALGDSKVKNKAFTQRTETIDRDLNAHNAFTY